MNAFTDTLEHTIKNHGPYTLANLADVNCPDTPESPGADLLSSVRDSTLEGINYALEDATSAEDALARLEDWLEDAPHEIADDGPSIYNYRRMQELTDLAAWDEDVSEYGQPSTIIEAAGYALYAVCERLVYALAAEVREALESIEEDAIEEDEA